MSAQETLKMQDVLITGPRKKKPKLLAYVDKGKCFGRGCEMCIHVCPVKDCIYLVPDPEPGAMGEICEINIDTCIGCQLCAKFCPPDYDAVHMFPFDEAVRLAESEEGTFEYRIYDKKDGGAIPA
jgi:ferredoxin